MPMRIWSLASEMAERTPPERNRYVDLLRAVSILVVVIGHWIIRTGWYVDGELTPGSMLESNPQMQWLTWLFQVMPIFFIVGGYSNAVSLESAQRKGVGFAGWLAARLHRLVSPLLLLLVVWAALALVMNLAGTRTAIIQFTTQAALIPTWFLAIYTMLVLLAPLAYKFWRRFGFASFFVFVALAAITDTAFFAADIKWAGWTNYFWVWLAVHQLGFAWRDGRLGGVWVRLAISAFGFAVLYTLIFLGPYPMAMVGSPDPDLSNTLPPKITLLALGLFQFGLLLAFESPMRRALDNLRLWTATVLINSMIMTLYLWHITVMIAVGSVMYVSGGFGFGIEPGTSEWWMTRPIWVGVLMIFLVPVALLLSPLERRSRPADAPIPGAASQITGAVMICVGIALLAMWGFGGGPRPWLDAAAFGLVLVGSVISGVLSRQTFR
ncbi:MAG: acyltransferase family protein [Gammaproteobacteria bacterium]|jgi:peptidoglycan/LPS O-acetylase OafA/YrhL|nr:acyltransferase family protein [Gammaproteobacteria bacterium]